MPSIVNNKSFKDSHEWRLYRHITTHEYLRDSEFSFETFPALDLTINAARKPTYYCWNIAFLIFLIALSSLSIFSIRCHLNASRLQIACTLLLTLVTFKWVINRTLPTVSYMTNLDKYQTVSMLLICGQIMWYAVISSVIHIDDKCVHPYALYDFVAFVFFCGLFLLINSVFVVWLVWQIMEHKARLKQQEIEYSIKIAGKRPTSMKSMLNVI